jgi:hypothetical protein
MRRLGAVVALACSLPGPMPQIRPAPARATPRPWRSRASEFGYGPADAARYNVRYRNVALSRISAERIQELYAQGGLPAVAARLHELRSAGAL